VHDARGRRRHPRIFHVYERNGDVIKIATLADFFGNRWQNNAVMILTPQGAGTPFLMPVAMVMDLYRKHTGENALTVAEAPDEVDITASRAGNRVFLHVANVNRTRPKESTESASGEWTLPAASVSAVELDISGEEG
jgi:alpha-L-arabinofuranosidase